MVQAAPTAHGAASRERLLDVAVELFARQGYGGTSVSAICRRAGVAPTALYWHFESKEGLLAAALDRATALWTERIERYARAASDRESRLDRLVAGLRALLEEHLDELALMLSTTLHCDQLGPAVRASTHRIHERVVGSLVQGLEESLGRRVPDADLVAFTVLAHVDALAILVRRDRPSRAALDRYFAHMREMIACAATRVLERAEGEPS